MKKFCAMIALVMFLHLAPYAAAGESFPSFFNPIPSQKRSNAEQKRDRTMGAIAVHANRKGPIAQLIAGIAFLFTDYWPLGVVLLVIAAASKKKSDKDKNADDANRSPDKETK